jgi:hypothetical protein
VESKWKNYRIITFPGQSLSKTLEEAMDLSQDRLILELGVEEKSSCTYRELNSGTSVLSFKDNNNNNNSNNKVKSKGKVVPGLN